MKGAASILVREGGARPFAEVGLPGARLDALERLLAEESRTSSERPLLTVDRVRRRVVAGDRVGFVCGRGLRIEVLPKFCSGSEADAVTARRRFLELLAWCGLVEWPEVPPSDADLWRRPLPVLLASLFLRELHRRVATGPYRAYRVRGGISPVVRGRIAFDQQLRRGDPADTVACRWRTFDADVEVNRILAAGVRAARSTGLADTGRADDLLARLGDEVGCVDPRTAARLEVRWDRRSAPWRPLVQLARLLLAGAGVAWGRPNEALWSFTVPVALLWERFLVRRFRGWRDVEAVGPKLLGHLLDEPVAQRRQIVDLAVRLTSGESYLLDAKYKQHDPPVVHDLRQVLVYATLGAHGGHSPRAVGLVYPTVDEWRCKPLGRSSWTGAQGVEVLEVRVPFRLESGPDTPSGFRALLAGTGPASAVGSGSMGG